MTGTQTDLFAPPLVPPPRIEHAPQIGHTDPRLPEQARARLGGQNQAVLARLRQGPALNTELEQASGSHRINSRVADVRRWLRANEGCTVLVAAVDTKAGVYRDEIGQDHQEATT